MTKTDALFCYILLVAVLGCANNALFGSLTDLPITLSPVDTLTCNQLASVHSNRCPDSNFTPYLYVIISNDAELKADHEHAQLIITRDQIERIVSFTHWPKWHVVKISGRMFQSFWSTASPNLFDEPTSIAIVIEGLLQEAEIIGFSFDDKELIFKVRSEKPLQPIKGRAQLFMDAWHCE